MLVNTREFLPQTEASQTVMRSRDMGQSRTDLDATVDEEAFEAFYAFCYEWSQITLQPTSNSLPLHFDLRTHCVPRNDTAPKSYVRPALTLCRLELVFEVCDRGGWRTGVERHVYDRRAPSRRCCLGPSPESLPLCSTRLVEMDMGANQRNVSRQSAWHENAAHTRLDPV